MNKIKNILQLLFILVYLIVILGFVNKEYGKVICNKIEICIKDSANIHFLQHQNILALMEESNNSLVGEDAHTIHTGIMEQKLMQHPAVKTAEIFWTVDGVLRVEIYQRLPIVRIIDQNQFNYFLDREGYILPADGHFSPHVLVVNGHISQEYRRLDRLDNQEENNILQDVFEISKFIYDDEFWRSQIEQLYINDKEEIELIPRVGSHIIILGNAYDYISKLNKLKALYIYGFSNVGWNQYERINLKYKNQVICTKR